MRKIKKGDDVIVLAGKEKGKRGNVLRVMPDERVVIQNINMIKRHRKPNPARSEAGGIIEKEGAIHISNVALFNPSTGKGERVGVRVLDDGRKVRYFKSSSEVVDV